MIDHGVTNLFFQSQIVLILTLIHLINYSFVLTNLKWTMYIILYYIYQNLLILNTIYNIITRMPKSITVFFLV